MEALNLELATEAAGDELSSQILGCPLDGLTGMTRTAMTADAKRIITAALPHILDALAEDAQNEADRKRICVSGQMQPHYMDSYARWLRAKAVEARQ